MKRETLATALRDVFCNWGLTLDISGVPKARPLDGLVRALAELKPNGNHRAELVLCELGLAFQVGLPRTKSDSALFRG